MPRMEFITLTLTDRIPTPSGLSWERPLRTELTGRKVPYVPQFYWSDGVPWHELNLWFLRQAELVSLGLRKIETLHAIGTSMKFYMKYLEAQNMNWWSFPEKYADRCLLKYRGWVISLRRSGRFSSTTCKRRMGDVLRFYDWVLEEDLLNPENSPFRKRQITIKVNDVVGFKRSLTVYRNELSISRSEIGSDDLMNDLEDGLEPLTQRQKKLVLEQARKYATEELHLMLQLSFSSGMRLGSICDLKMSTLDNAVPCFENSNLLYLHIGPKARGVPVATKYNVTGRVIVPDTVLKLLRSYCQSVRRLFRVAKAEDKHKDIIFLTKNGRPYSRGGKDQSNAVNVQIHRMKDAARQNGTDLLDFKFHRARATFASEIAVLGLKFFGPRKIPAVIGLIRKLLMHKDEKTSLAYISFIQEQELLDEWESEFYSKAMPGQVIVEGLDEASINEI